MADNNFDEEVFEDGPPKEAKTIHRMRANSSIMQINKILGKFPPLAPLNSPCRADFCVEFTVWIWWLTLFMTRSCEQRRNS